eukprot:2365076-Amphidinium_carterae.1
MMLSGSSRIKGSFVLAVECSQSWRSTEDSQLPVDGSEAAVQAHDVTLADFPLATEAGVTKDCLQAVKAQ